MLAIACTWPREARSGIRKGNAVMRTGSSSTWKWRATAALIALASLVFIAPQALASSGPSHAAIPLYSPCQITSWVQIDNALYTYTSGGVKYTVADSLQEEYDSGFSVWCNVYRTNTALTATGGNPGGTLIVKVAACGGSFYPSTYSFPSGAFGPYHYASPAKTFSGSAQSGHELKAGSLDASDHSQCYSG